MSVLANSVKRVSEKILTRFSSKQLKGNNADRNILLSYCTKRIEGEFLDTDGVQLKTLACYLWQI